MNIEARKISFIQEFLNLNSEETISHFEDLMNIEKNKFSMTEKEPFTLDEFNARIDQSLADSKNGKLTESKDLISEIKKWD